MYPLRLQTSPGAAFTGLLAFCTLLLLPAPAVAAERLDVLILNGQSNHDWQQTTAAISATLLNTGRFNVDRSTSPPAGAPAAAWAAWRPQFATYDVVVSIYKGEMWPAAVRADFEAYIVAGGGVVIFHAPLATFIDPHLNPGETEWSAYSNMMSLGWRTSPVGQRLIVDDATNDPIFIPPPFGGTSNHGLQHNFRVKSRRPAHPIMDGLPTEWLHGKDEFYHAMRGPADNITVLASAFSDPATGGTAAHEPMLWTVPYGAGRVVTTVMGHRWFGEGYGAPGTSSENGPDALHCVGFQTLLARSAEWAATGAVTIPVPAAFPSATNASIVHPLRGTWLRLPLKINGEHPPSDVVATPGPVQLTLGMDPGGFVDPLDFFFGIAYQNQLVWFTQAGPSLTPAPLASLTPVALADANVLTLDLLPGASMTFVVFFANGPTLLAYDLISAASIPTLADQQISDSPRSAQALVFEALKQRPAIRRQ